MKNKVILMISGIALLAAAVLTGALLSVRADRAAEAEPVEIVMAEPVVRPEPTEEIVLIDSDNPGEPVVKTIYLTFDDGPYKYTEKLLNILDAAGVKATFFVTGQNPEYLDLIAREHEAGHTVGIHTYSHVYKQIYAGEDAFWTDFDRMQEVIMEQTGQTARLYRFPGGSDNTVSESYSSGIVKRLIPQLEEKGIIYHDWNLSSGDSDGIDTAEGILNHVTTHLPEMEETEIIILQHDIYDYSVDAAERIIEWGLANGYRFAALDESVEPFHCELNE